jgi:NADPH:quinone reductase-like Zn-dependent oxidoreductase
MKAVRIKKNGGGPETFEIVNVPSPEPAQGEVLIRVHAASANPVDYKIAHGAARSTSAKPPLPVGRDVAGIVERCGPGVHDFAPGDQVIAMLERDRGGFAELVATRADNCAMKPKSLDDREAAAVPLAGVTAWQGLFDHGGLAKGQSVLIHGAAGGVGHFAVQFAKAKGAKVFATCAHEDKSFVERLGADEAIDYQSERFEDRVKNVDLVFDLVAGETQERSWAVLKEGGVLVSTLGEPSREQAAAHKARGVGYVSQPDGAELAEIGRLIDEGEVEPVVARTFTLDRVAEAETALEHEHVRGKIVVTVV